MTRPVVIIDEPHRLREITNLSMIQAIQPQNDRPLWRRRYLPGYCQLQG
ncbi:hypothetical protein KCP70_17890 [Salmonella enterica subsp. enterica]|nr:hypothetical protein KCP70_17890 [Salmonella enterica subsp. enterica]